MIRNIIFDIGNVLAMAHWPSVFMKMGIPKEHIEAVADATVRHPLWHEYDRGVLAEEIIIQRLIEEAPQWKEDIMKIFNQLEQMVDVCDYAEEWVKSFHDQGYQVYILSNFPEHAFMACKPRFRFLDHADGVVVSYMHKVIKPEKAIYDILVDQYGLRPEESVLIDDLQVNIRGAVENGFHGVVFTGKDQAQKEIDLLCQKHLTKS